MKNENIQANILQGHKKRYVLFLPFKFTEENEDKQKKCSDLKSLVNQLKLSSAESQDDDNCIVSCYLTAQGLQDINKIKDEKDLDDNLGIVEPKEGDGLDSHRPFLSSLDYHERGWTGDPYDPCQKKNFKFEVFDQTNMDGVIVIAANEMKDICDVRKERINHGGSQCINILQQHVFWGRQDKYKDDKKEYPVDPLGYRDKIVNPTNIKGDVLTTIHGLDGTFVALVLIEIDQQKFESLIEKIKSALQSLPITNGTAKPSNKSLTAYAEATVMGRFKNGKLLNTQKAGSGSNLSSHVSVLTSKKSLNILRRGLTWISPNPLGRPDDEKIGLVFLSFQKNLRDSFQEAVTRMANGKDLITYVPKRHTGPRLQLLLKPPWSNKSKSITLDFDDLDFKGYGGESYFFAPNLPFFDNLCK